MILKISISCANFIFPENNTNHLTYYILTYLWYLLRYSTLVRTKFITRYFLHSIVSATRPQSLAITCKRPTAIDFQLFDVLSIGATKQEIKANQPDTRRINNSTRVFHSDEDGDIQHRKPTTGERN